MNGLSSLPPLTFAQGIQVLEDALRASPSTIVVAEPFLFNLCKVPASTRNPVVNRPS